MNKPLVVISGPSGSGKTTICNHLARRPGFRHSVSDTTRPPRPGEVDGQDYHFLSRDEFEAGAARGRYLEHAEIYGQLYGTPRRGIEEAAARGERMLLNIDVQGAQTLREQGEDATYIFLMPPSLAVLEERLRGRETDDPQVIARRLAEAEQEMAQAEHYDHIVVNDDLEHCVEQIEQLLGVGGPA